MAELPRFFVTGPTARVGPSRTARTTAPLARLNPADFAAPGQAAAGIGQAVAGLGQVVQQIDAKFKAARSLIDAEQAETGFRSQLQDASQAQLGQQFPDPVAFRDNAIQVRDEMAANLSPESRGRFLQTTNELIFRQSAALANENRSRINNQGKASFASKAQRHQADMVGLDAELSGELEDKFRASSADFVRTGLVRGEAVEAAIVAGRSQQVMSAIQADPFAAEDAILAGRLGAGLLPTQKQQLINMAQAQQSRVNGQADRADRLSDAQKEDDQLLEAVPHYGVVMDPESSVATLESEFNIIQAKHAAGELTTRDFVAMAGAITSKTRLATETSRVQLEKNSGDVRAHLEASLYLSSTADQREMILIGMIEQSNGMTPRDFADSIKLWNVFADSAHITNQPPVREGLKLIAQAFTGVTDPSSLALILQGMDEKARGNLVTANAIYASRMEILRGTTDAALTNARDEALKVIKEFLPEVDISKALGQPGAAPVEATRTAPAVAPIQLPAEMEPMTFDEGLTHLETLMQRDNSEDREAYYNRLIDTWTKKHGRE